MQMAAMAYAPWGVEMASEANRLYDMGIIE